VNRHLPRKSRVGGIRKSGKIREGPLGRARGTVALSATRNKNRLLPTHRCERPVVQNYADIMQKFEPGTQLILLGVRCLGNWPDAEGRPDEGDDLDRKGV
jgi:hypothetical protein